MGVGTVLVYSILLAVIPLSAFFAVTQGLLDSVFAALLGTALTTSTRLVLAGVTGVVCVNLVVAAFLVSAWREPVPPAASQQRAKTS